MKIKLLLLFSLLFLNISVLAQSHVREIYEKVSPSTVVIKTELGAGSGFIVDSSGIIVTAYHVVDKSTRVAVKIASGDIYDKVVLLAKDERKDIAILKIPGFNLPSVELGNSDSLRPGDQLVVVANPLGLEGSVSNGILSGIRDFGDGYKVLQTTAPTSSGSSGGGVFTEDGKVIGVHSFKLLNGQNINFSIPINYVRGLLAGVDAKNPILAWEKLTISEDTVLNRTAVNKDTDDITGVYTGIWSSNKFDVSGTIVMTVKKIDGKYEVYAAFTGSKYFNEDTLIATFTKLGGSAYKMEYKGKKSKISGTGLFRGGQFTGDYKFRKFIWVDTGKWFLEK